MFQPYYLYWRQPLAVLLLVSAVQTACAQSQPPSLAQAVDAAWALSTAARSQANRQVELEARQRASQALLAGPASITLSQQNDRFNARQGYRENEAELALPLWNPGVRQATARQIDADRNTLQTQAAATKLRLAGELRELLASAHLATVERDLAARKQADAAALLQDVQRRVQAGDSPRIDRLQAQATERQAAVQLAQAQSALAQLLAQWRVLTGLTQLAQPETSLGTALPEHPATLASQAQLASSQARLALTEADRRDPLELGLGVRNERDSTSSATQNSLRFALRIPFGGDNRNAPKLAAARAELDAAQAEFDAAQRQRQSDLATAQTAWHSAQAALALASERAALSSEAQALVAKAYRLGESDLPTRLRFEADKFDAELALARARIEAQRATARFNQANGLLP